ncbi:MAG: DUF4838 domain-containing protein, partial [Armatimonadetes bacterium]|nr:DUF4838 domain-containing protein [Armatimonadota bacterium]
GADGPRDDFGPEEFRIQTIGSRVVIVGGSPRGVLYGANSLLTDEWGCRWFAPAVKHIPKHERLTLKVTDRRYEPPFEWRDAYFWSGLDNEWAFHNFLNKDFAGLRPEQGWRAGYAHNMSCHTELRLVPPERYREAHPEYFWTGMGDETRMSKRHKSETLGICLTHPEVARIIADNILAIRDKGEWMPKSDCVLWFSVSREDGVDNWCQCPDCMDFYNRHGGLKPYQSGALGAAWLHLAGRVDQILQERGEEVKISTLAYKWNAIPPTSGPTFPRINVLYAPQGQWCQFHALSDPDCPKNTVFREHLSGWLKYAGSVYMYFLSSYQTIACTKVNPTTHLIAENMRYLRSVGVKGIFAQGNQGAWWGDRFFGEMTELRAYLHARLMWNPDLDWQQERREFLEAYYGPEPGRVIERYLGDLEQTFARHKVHGNGDAYDDTAISSWVTPAMIARWYSYMDEAESLATDAERKRLVRIARLPIQRTELLITKDETKRRELMQAWLDDSRALGANVVPNWPQPLDTPLRRWAEANQLEWK